MRRLYLRDCAPGDTFEDVLVICGKQLGATQTGKHFIKAQVSDRTCQLNARMWNATRDIFSAIPESGFLLIRGRIENYQNNLQFIIEGLWPAKDGAFDIDDLMPHTSKNVNEMCRRLHELLGSIQNRHLAAMVQAYLEDDELLTRFCKAPAAMSFHHAFIGGLLEHTLNAMEVADAVVRFYPGLNRDLLLAGIFLHDIAKTWELSYDCAFGYTDGGHLVGHIVKSAMWVEHKARIAEQTLGEKIPQNLIDVLQHIIISHHGEPQFGAVKAPCTPEAIAVHMIENMDAKLTMALAATRGEAAPGAEGNFTEYMKVFSGRLYRPDVAPVDAADAGPPDPDVSRDEAGNRNLPKTAASDAGAPARNPSQAGATNASPGASAPAKDGKLTIHNPLFETAPAKK
jgi:3'-5' exoribonuclease